MDLYFERLCLEGVEWLRQFVYVWTPRFLGGVLCLILVMFLVNYLTRHNHTVHP